MEEKTAQTQTNSEINTPPVSDQPVSGQTKKNKPSRNVIIVIALVILAVILVAGFSFKKASGPTSTQSSQENSAHTNLSISENPRANSQGNFETDVNIDSGADKATGVQLSLSYDPKALTNVDIKPGSFFQNPTIISKKIDPDKGTISFLIGVPQGEKGVSGAGQLAVISFTKTNSQNTNINFLPDTLVSAEGSDQSALSKTSSAIIGPLPTQ